MISRALLLLVTAIGAGEAGPTYGNDAARLAVERMVAAHGGLAGWRALTTLRYDNIFFNPNAPAGSNPWWVARETFSLPERLTYQAWPLDRAKIGYDGRDVWSTGWQRGNPPKHMSFFFFQFVNLPWLTQESNAVMGGAGPTALPGLEGVYDTVRVHWTDPTLPGRTERDFFLLYIERASGLLRAYQYGSGYGALLDALQLPPERNVFGPVLRFQDDFITVDGLVFPARMHTGNVDASQTFGYHTILNYSTADVWMAEQSRPPAGAVIDRSSAERRPAP